MNTQSEDKRKAQIEAAKASYKAFIDELDRLKTAALAKGMPSYFQFSSDPQNYQSIYPTAYTHPISFNEVDTKDVRKERKRNNAQKRKLYHYSPTEYSQYYAALCKTFDLEIDDKVTALERDLFEIRTLQVRSLNALDFHNTMISLKTELLEMDEKMPVTHFFKEGPSDTALVGQYLVLRQEEWNDETTQKAVSILGGMQWLLKNKEKLIIDELQTSSQRPVSDTQANLTEEFDNTPPFTSTHNFEIALSTLLLEYLKFNEGKTNIEIDGRQWNKTRLLVGIMHVLEQRGTLPSKDENAYAKLLGTIIGGDSNNIRKRINKRHQEIKPFNRNLKDLNADYIKRNAPDNEDAVTAKEYNNNWEGMYEMIDTLIETKENLAPLRKKGAQLPSVL